MFCSYSRKDERFRRQFDSSVALLRQQGLVNIWHDRKIDAGSEWVGEIDEHLNSADIVTLFISADFLASDYCYERELRRALEREAQQELEIVPIIIRKCDWEEAPFARFQAIPTGAKPVKSWSDRDAAWTDVAKSLRGTVRKVLTRKLAKIRAELKFFGVPVEEFVKHPPPPQDAQSLYNQIARDAVAQREERLRISADLQARIFGITAELGPVQTSPKKTASGAFHAMDRYISEK